ncbi:hypothetical protein BMETH_1992_0 [methanotrophic bacterial endosymbiont of Bathymodiolus sp.]|nr:hypothetical protein BMETH_1992_0 [methanotrophic bacterial endosymbiont of Bathymodiolus sp.]
MLPCPRQSSPFPAKLTSQRIEARSPNSAATFGLLIFKPESNT